MSFTCFEHYLLILRRRYTSGAWYIACVLCQLAATRVGVELGEIKIYFVDRDYLRASQSLHLHEPLSLELLLWIQNCLFVGPVTL
jgi:hypothetical protein